MGGTTKHVLLLSREICLKNCDLVEPILCVFFAKIHAVTYLVSVCFLATLFANNTLAQDNFDHSLLLGDWCYKTILTSGSSDVKIVDTNWVFSDTGNVEIQSEWMRGTTSIMPYVFSQDSIEIPRMNKKYEVRKLTESEMLIVNPVGNSENVFLRGRCE